MSAPEFGRLDDLDRLTFGRPPGRVNHQCVASWGFACPGPGPHDPLDRADPATVPAFPELDPTPSLWSVEPARPAPAPVAIRRPRCPECGRSFDLLDPDDASEWAAGHDCEPPEPDILRPIGTDNDGNGIWTDGTETWNAGEPLTAAEAAEAATTTERPDPCAIRYSDAQDGPLTACTLPAGHSGRHETHTRREARP